MKTQKTKPAEANLLDELIDNAATLPLGSLDLLLMLSKAMKHTHDCIVQQELNKPNKSKSA